MFQRTLISLMALVALAACEQGAKARNQAIAAEVLTRTGAPDFVDASTAERAAVRHTPSGLICVMPFDGTLDMGVFPASSANAGAHCTIARGQIASTLVAVRFSGRTTLDQIFNEAVASTVRAPTATRWSGRASAADQADATGLPNHRVGRFEIMVNETPSYVRVAAGESRGWYLQQVVSAPLTEAEQAETLAGAEWRAALQAFGDASNP
jgi:hypothetical protein